VLGLLAANPWQTPGHTPGTPNGTLAENRSLEFALAANRVAQAGDWLEVTASGSGGERAQVLTGAETLSFVSGSLAIALTPGQSLINLSLLSFGDFDTDEQVMLTVTLRDAQGNAIGAPATMNVLFDAIDEQDPTPVFTLNGDLAPNTYNNPGDPDHNKFLFSFNYTFAGLPSSLGYFFGNVVEGTASPDRADRLIGGDDADALYGLGGTDAINGNDGDDYLDGGAGDDWLTGGRGADRIFGGTGNDLIFSGAAISPVVTYYSTDPNPEQPLPPSSSYSLLATGWNWYLVQFTNGSLGVAPAAGLSILNTTAMLTDDGGDFVDAGDGDDTVDAGYGDDVIQGGRGGRSPARRPGQRSHRGRGRQRPPVRRHLVAVDFGRDLHRGTPGG
jgi:Ca2+-binding RTX toxin-like protein